MIVWSYRQKKQDGIKDRQPKDMIRVCLAECKPEAYTETLTVYSFLPSKLQ